jgi:hypothetical protein
MTVSLVSNAYLSIRRPQGVAADAAIPSAQRPRSPLSGDSAKGQPAQPDTPLATSIADSLRTARGKAEDLHRKTQEARVGARDAVKARARQKLQQLGEQFKLIRKLYAANPKEMARQLARLARELKQELKAYAEAAKDNGEYLPSGSSAAANASAADTGAADAQAARPLTPAPDPARAEREARALSAHADLDFIDLVKGFLKGVREELTTAKTRAAFLEPEKTSRADPFKEADEALKDVNKDIADMEKSAKADLPVPGTLVSETA